MEIFQILVIALLLMIAFIGGYITALQDKAEQKQHNDINFELITLKKPSTIEQHTSRRLKHRAMYMTTATVQHGSY